MVYYIYLVIFGILGALSRYGLDVLIDAGHFPLATLAVNLSGCFLLAFVTTYIARASNLSSKFVSAVGAGFIGSFTTFSTFVLEASILIQSGKYIILGTYVFASLFGGLIACIFGYNLSVIFQLRRKRGYYHGE